METLKFRIDSRIVHIMKHKKKMIERDLIDEVMSDL
jgi:hypothetical protein